LSQTSIKGLGTAGAFFVSSGVDGVNMRRPAAHAVAATKATAGYPDATPVELVCLALLLAIVALAFRILTVW
jgi:hypothetical protein